MNSWFTPWWKCYERAAYFSERLKQARGVFEWWDSRCVMSASWGAWKVEGGRRKEGVAIYVGKYGTNMNKEQRIKN